MSSIAVFNFTINLSALFVTVLLIIAVLLSGDLRQSQFRIFLGLVFLSLLAVSNEALIYLLEGNASVAGDVLIRVLDYFSYVIPAVLAYYYGLYLYRFLQRKGEVATGLFWALGVVIAGAILYATFGAVTQMNSYFDALNYYHTLDTFWVGQLFFAVIQLLFLAITIHHLRLLNTRERVCLLLYPVIILVCLTLETFIDGIWLTNFGVALMMFLVYVNLEADQQQRIKQQEEELAEAHISIMLSQIQPHFLYNTLSVINHLCDGNSTAQKAIITFASYLRSNMDSLSEKKLIPFSKELEHVEQYLYLESLRFGDRLNVIYDIDAAGFMIPVLTLQPLVENAVRYGVTERQSGGTVRIQSEETERSYRIMVIDDGVGFDRSTKEDDERSHTGIANVEMRLKLLCNGSLVIESEPGIGSTATIELPK